MTREEYIKLFHKEQLNLVAFKRLMDCDEEVLRLVNKAIEKEREECAKINESCRPLYTTPQRTWVGLTKMELVKCGVFPWGMSHQLYEAIEAKLKEKNGY